MNPETAYCVTIADRSGVMSEYKGLTFGGAVAKAVLKKNLLMFHFPHSCSIVVSNLDMCDYDSHGLTEEEQLIVDDALDEVLNG